MLMTDAPLSSARATPPAESAQLMPSALSGTLSARMPGQTPRMPAPLDGAAATEAVAVPWKCAGRAGLVGSVVTFEPTNSR